MAGKGTPIEDMISLIGKVRDGVRKLGRVSIMNKQQSKKEHYHGIIHDLWKQYPRGVVTVGPCCRVHCLSDIGARGGGACAVCIEGDLAELVGSHDAYTYHAHIADLRRLEREFEKRVS